MRSFGGGPHGSSPSSACGRGWREAPGEGAPEPVWGKRCGFDDRGAGCECPWGQMSPGVGLRRSAERRVGKEVSVRVDLGCRRLITYIIFFYSFFLFFFFFFFFFLLYFSLL